jgi:thioredoxin-related protein
MKKILAFMLAVFAVGQIIAQDNIQSIPVGTTLPSPEIKMEDISGKEISIKDAESKNGVLVMFSCNTCPYVIKNQERTNQINEYALKNNVGVIVVNSNEAQRSEADSYKAMKEYAEKQGYKWYYVVDKNSKVANAFGATKTPEVFLFDASGKLVYKGAIDDNPSDANNVKREHLKEAINEVISGKAVSIKESRSVGCTIKRS